MTIAQLKEYAAENNIDLGKLKTKSEIVSSLSSKEELSENNLVLSTTVKDKGHEPKSATKSNSGGVVTTATADNFTNKEFKKEEPKGDKLAIFSEKNVAWSSVGRISKGYNIVTKEAAKMWLTRKGIREASPSEVASHYGL